MSYEPIMVGISAITAKAVQVMDGDREVWIPKSIIEESDLEGVAVGDIVELNVQSWFLKKEGML